MGPASALVRVARALNAAEVSAAPIDPLRAVSIYTDDEYENYDLDVIGPRQRLKLIDALRAAGFEHVSGSELRHGDLRLRFPRTVGILGADPVGPARSLVEEGGAIALLTPTQVALLLIGGAGDEAEGTAGQLLADLAFEQPLNIGKIVQWAHRRGTLGAFNAMREEIEARQAAGIAARRAGTFRSGLPR
jgi:hypothetical protein